MVAGDARAVSDAGAEVLRVGGNAVDAAVAAALSAGVVQPAGSGLGGGGFAVVVLPDGTRRIVDFREVAPAAATRTMYQDADGAVTGNASRVGPAAVAVPGESRGLAWLVERYGDLPHRVVAGPAIRQAAQGFPLGAHLAAALKNTKHDEVRALFSGVDLRPGETVRRQALAGTLRRWAASGGEDLHTGSGARAIASEVDGKGPTREDLAAYAVVEREPIAIPWRGKTVLTMPPPSSGGVVLGQVLRVLEDYDLESLGHNSSDYLHILTEAMKHAYADRAHHLGDPDFVEVPTERLLSDGRRDAIRQAIWPGRTFEPDHYGPLIAPPQDGGTQHISVRDAKGGAVALTTTINTGFGSGVVVESAGLILNNEMDDFSSAPGTPNAYGLVGSEANAIEAGKRPLSSMSPTVILDENGEVEMVVGASGGSTIISSSLQAILNVLVFGMDAQEAVSAPRIHHQWQPDMLILNHGIPEDVARALEARGHAVTRQKTRQQCKSGGVFECFRGNVQMVAVVDGEVQGGADPEKGGWPAGTW